MLKKDKRGQGIICLLCYEIQFISKMPSNPPLLHFGLAPTPQTLSQTLSLPLLCHLLTNEHMEDFLL